MIVVTVCGKPSPTGFDTKEKAVDAINSFYSVLAWHGDYAVDSDGREIRLHDVSLIGNVMDFKRPK